ncbi:MAG TPA: glycosyltransferase family 9 protein [Candidatus Sulfotelmatobacter sp.]|nr:glycosyltransferase family 9 protein [Candidatus Sulfotelmatobacter sp.]
MSAFPKALTRALPGPLYSTLRPVWRKFRAIRNRLFDRVLFPLWLVGRRIRHGKKLVIVYRIGALGDAICTLPLCRELQKRHPGTAVIFFTHADYKKMIMLSRDVDGVYGAKSWEWPFSLPARYKLPGVVRAIYNPKTTDELFPNRGAQLHLIDDLAGSCGVTVPPSDRQPRLVPPPELIKKVQSAYGLAEDVARGRLIIGINCGRSWPVRMWDAAKWQALLDKIHAEFDATVLQFGLTKGKEDEFEQFRGVRCLTNRLKSDEIVALAASCHLIIAIDSGPVHVAGSVAVPVVGLFGAVKPQFRLPPNSPGEGVFTNVPCLFCHHATPLGHWQTGCAYDIRCMKELDAQTVFEAAKGMLLKYPHRVAAPSAG